MTPIKFAILHDTVFIGGKNFDCKLDPNRYAGIQMEYNEEKGELWATWNKETLRIPKTNVRGMVEGTFAPRQSPVSHAMNVSTIGSAQVETPYGHVHAGPGKGKTGK